MPVHIPPPELCTDNAAMIASAARYADAVAVSGLPRARRLRHRPPSRSIAVPAATSATTPARRCERVRARATFSLHEVDITTDDELHRRYLERIPVVALGDEELFDFFVDEAALEARLYRLPR